MGWASALTCSARGQGHANSRPAVSRGPARPSTLSPLRGLPGSVALGSAEDGPGYGGRGLRRRGAGLRRRARPSRGFRRRRAVPARARGGGARRGAFGVRAGPSGRLGGRHAANGEGTPGPRVQPSGSIAGLGRAVGPAGAGSGRGRGQTWRTGRPGRDRESRPPRGPRPYLLPTFLGRDRCQRTSWCPR